MTLITTPATTPTPVWKAWWRSGRLSQYLLLLACAAGVAGLLTSRALVALSPVAAVVAAFLNPNVRKEVPCWLRLRTVWAPAGLYLLLFLSGLYTQEWPTWRHEMYRLLPWLGVPLAFGVAVPLSARQRFWVGLLFVGGVGLVGAATMGQYFLDPATANVAFGLGQSMPSITRIFHIHFGLMLALATFFGVSLRREPWANKLQRTVLLLAVGSCILTLHVLAYRTGLMALYGMLLIDTFLVLIVQRRLWLGLALLLGLTLGPWIAYQSLESVQQRVESTIYDILQFELKHDINQYSLSRRLAAWQTAAVIARQHPLLGVGPADAYRAMMKQYDLQSYGLQRENRVMIHNQYLHQLVGGGLVGLGLWLFVLFGPLMQPAQRRNPYVYRFLLLQALAMMVDSLLELQISYNLFVFLYGFLVVATERRTTRKTFLPADGISSTFV
ncbi:O-antigen ligase domain-containing protein [Hymenobacter sediminis]|uniref:O-antigen ligase family protein n=1 Tax=Hymenobacter sediminis TaxID=2218621 RepID=UPI000DA675EB|nr:O-antigen ligase family protein [Hymenobacter sediminis]RPD49890.1 O-antigen ligase domain-containing protein [Hymenobacter sediminis]